MLVDCTTVCKCFNEEPTEHQDLKYQIRQIEGIDTEDRRIKTRSAPSPIDCVELSILYPFVQ